MLVIAQDHSWAPFAFEDSHGRAQGLLVDLWQVLGEQMGREIRFELSDWNASLEAVRDGQADLHGGLLRSPEREAYLDFSLELMPLRAAMFVPAGSTALTMDELDGQRIRVTAGGFEEEHLRTRYPALSLQTYPNNQRLIEAAVKDEVQAFVADYPVGMYYLDQYTTPDRFRVLTVLYQKPLHAAVALQNTALLAEINQALASLPRETLNRVLHKWMRSEQVATLPAWLLPSLLAGLLLMAVIGLFVHTRLLNARVASQTRTLAEREQRMRLLTDSMSDVIWTMNGEYRYDYVSPSVLRLRGYTAEEILEHRLEDSVTLTSLGEVEQILSEAASAVSEGKESSPLERSLIVEQPCKDGSTIWSEVNARLFYDATGQLQGIHGVTRNITQRYLAEQQLRQQQAIDRVVAEASTLLMTEANLDRAINLILSRFGEYGQASHCYLFQFREQEDGRQRMSISHEWHGKEVTSYRAHLQDLLLADYPWWQEQLMRGRPIHIPDTAILGDRAAAERTLMEQLSIRAMAAVPLRIADRVQGFIGVDTVTEQRVWPEHELNALNIVANLMANVIQARRNEARLAHQASHDFLTDLPNRQLFLDRLELAMNLGRRDGSGVTVLYLELRGLKSYNETWGHQHGDELLQEVARRCRRILRESDTVARYSGDEFAILISPCTPELGRQLMQGIRGAVEQPYFVGSEAVCPGYRLGMARYPEHAGDAFDLLQQARKSLLTGSA